MFHLISIYVSHFLYKVHHNRVEGQEEQIERRPSFVNCIFMIYEFIWWWVEVFKQSFEVAFPLIAAFSRHFFQQGFSFRLGLNLVVNYINNQYLENDTQGDS